MIEINWQPNRKELRVFFALLIVFCGFVALMVWHRTGQTTVPSIIAGTGLVLGLFGCLWPSAARPIYLSWMLVTFPIGWTVSHLMLGAIYFLVFTPVGWLLRCAGHDPLKRSSRRSQGSYWETRPESRKPTDYFRQF